MAPERLIGGPGECDPLTAREVEYANLLMEDARSVDVIRKGEADLQSVRGQEPREQLGARVGGRRVRQHGRHLFQKPVS